MTGGDMRKITWPEPLLRFWGRIKNSKWVGPTFRFLIAAGLFILLGLLADLLNFSLLPLADRGSIKQPFVYEPDITPVPSADSYYEEYWLASFKRAGPTKRQVVVEISAEQITVEFNLTLAKTEPLAETIADGKIGRASWRERV
jgi:hypothetical protein